MNAALPDQPLGDFLEAVAAKTPAPGGGAVASAVAALAAALAQMTVNFSLGKKSLASHGALHAEAADSLREHGARALALAQEDARAFADLNDLLKRDADDPVRAEKYAAAVEAAIAAPQGVVHVGMEILRLVHRLCGKTNVMLASDLAIAGILAEAAVKAGAWNIRVNLPLLEDSMLRDAIERTIVQTVADAATLARDVEIECMPGEKDRSRR